MWEEEDVEVRMCPEIGSEEWELGRREVGLRAHMHMVTCAHGVLVHREGVSLCTLLGKICIMQIHPLTSQFPSFAHILMYIELHTSFPVCSMNCTIYIFNFPAKHPKDDLSEHLHVVVKLMGSIFTLRAGKGRALYW